MSKSLNRNLSPILVLGYKRVELLRNVLNSILDQEHGPIFVSCDLSENSDLIRNLLENLVQSNNIEEYRISSSHEGLRIGVISGIDWFFKKNTSGWIFEDDIIVLPNALKYAESALNYCGTSTQVYSVNLFNTVSMKPPYDNLSWRISLLSSSHGWGTTREKWNFFRSESFVLRQGLDVVRIYSKSFGSVASIAEYLRVKNNQEDSWCVSWHSFILSKNGMILQSNQSLVTNFGDDVDSTHKHQRIVYRENSRIILQSVPKIDQTNFKNLLYREEFKLADKQRCRREFGNDTLHIVYRVFKFVVLSFRNESKKMKMVIKV